MPSGFRANQDPGYSRLPTASISLAHGGQPGPPQVPTEFDQLEKASAQYRELVERLQQKLAAVLPSTGEHGEERLRATCEPLCPLAHQIPGVSDRLADGNAILGRLIESLQV